MSPTLNFHTLALDRVVGEGREGARAFHLAPAPSEAEVAEALATVHHRVRRLLVRGAWSPATTRRGR